MSNPTHKGVLAAVFGSFCGACFLIPWKLATRYGPPELLVLVMLSAAALLNSVAAAFQLRGTHSRAAGQSPSLPLASSVLLAAAFAVLTLLGNTASAEAVKRIPGALLSVLQRSDVLLVGVLGWLALGERVRPSFWVGSAVACAGLAVLHLRAAPEGDDLEALGVLLGLLSAVCFGSMIVLTRKYITRINLLLLNTLRLWLSVLFWFVINRRVPTSAELSPELLGLGTLAAFFGPFLSRLAVLVSARYVPANVTAFAALATPLMTLGLAALVLGNVPAERELIGGGIMLLGIAIPIASSLRRA